MAADLVETHVRRRRHDDARAALVRLEQHAVAANRPSLQAAAARSRGLLAPPHAFRQHFEEALRLHAQMPTPFERARTELCFGERLRRTRRRAEARTHLVSALATFERLGAAPWVERARRELGSKARPSDVGADIEETLTPHERQVASLVVQGATNGEAARTLFVTPKAVEYHLSNIYRKLDIRSRTQLTRLFLERR